MKRSAGRPKKEPDEVLVDLPIKVSPEALKDVEQIADQLERPRGWVARKLLMRGMESYTHDLQTKRPEDAIQLLLDVPDQEVKRQPSQPTDRPSPKTPTTITRSPGRQRDAINKALDGARAKDGQPLSEENRKIIREALEKLMEENWLFTEADLPQDG